MASAPREWHGDRIWVLVCVCAEFAEGDFRTRPRLVRRTLDYVVDLNGKLREKMEGGERGHVKLNSGNMNSPPAMGFYNIHSRSTSPPSTASRSV